jgi:Ca2+/Na+ antiporter
MLFGANGQVFALLLFFLVAIPLTIVVSVSLWKNPKPQQKQSDLDQTHQHNQPSKGHQAVAFIKLAIGLALIAIGVTIFLNTFWIAGPQSVAAIFAVPFAVVGLLPIVDGLRGLSK